MSSPTAQNDVFSYVSNEEYEHEAVMSGMGTEDDW